MSENETSSTSLDPAVSRTEADVDPLIGTVISDRYRVDERLGVGGMGAVYRAEHVLMKKPVAVKVLHREMTVLAEVVKRFEREAIAAGRIDHPNVTVATDFGKLPNGSFFLVLEYVPGRALSKAMQEDGPFPAERALFITRQVAAALSAAHAADIVHRDLKPDNIMLIERGGTKDFVKVLDFGIAKVNSEATTGPLTRIGAVFGTPQYMAPEQAAGKPVDGRADLYSLGLVLYEMLAGRAAFASDDIVAILTKQLTEPPPPLPDTIDAGVRDVVKKLVEKDPEARVQTGLELVAFIDAKLGPAALPPDSTVFGVPSSRSAASVAAATAPGPLEAPSSRSRRAALDALGALRGHAATLVTRTLAGDSVRLGRRDVPLRALAAGGAALVLTIAVVAALRGGPHHPVHAGGAPSAPAAPAEPELGGVMARASEGDRAALAILEKRPESRRTGAEWAAIGRGHVRQSEFRVALSALERAVQVEPALAEDHDVLAAVRRIADEEPTQKAALELSSGLLGAGGADVLFDVWASTSEKTETTMLAKSMLDREQVREHASKSLRVALELRRVTRCEEAKKLVLQAREFGDERAFRPLKALTSRKGCGFLGLGDCFSCLRSGDDLNEALKVAQQRKGPRF